MKFLVYLCLSLLTLLANVASGVRLIREKGFKDNSYFYHQGDGGYAYHYNVETATSIYFKCVLYESGCRGRAILKVGGGFRHTKTHNHPADPNFVGERHFRQNVLRQVEERRDVTFQDVLNEARRDRRYNRRVRSRMTLRRLRTPMHNARRKFYPPLPDTLQDLTRILLQHPRISSTVDGLENMYAGSVTATDGSHHVAFFSQRMLTFLSTLKIIQSDGTFRSRPAIPHSSQCFVLVGTWRDAVIPLGWVLMERRTTAAYRAVFHLLRQLCPQMNPDVIITDWEYAQQQAWSEAFPNSRLQGCLWHLCRAFVKKVSTLGLMRFRRALPEMLTFVRKASAISLLPQRYFRNALAIVKRQAREEDIAVAYLLRPFFTYVKERWINNPRRNQWMSFSGAKYRTNNSCETHNRMLRKQVGAYRPNIYAFIEAISKLEHNAKLDVELMAEGASARRTRKWQSIFADAQLKALSRDLRDDIFHDRDVALTNFINRASHLYQGAFDDHVRRQDGDE